MLKIKSMENFMVNLILLFSLTLCQDTILVANSNLDDVSSNSTQQDTIPETLLIQMKDVLNISDLLRRFVASDEHDSLIEGNQTNNYESRRALSGVPASSIAQPANCQTEQHVVELDKPGNGATIYWPSCVRVRRCGGCCTSKMLACKPLATSILNITVLQLQYNHQNPNSLESQGTRVFSLEQHDRCACSCKEQQDDCNPDVHEYKQHECKCVCKNAEEAAACSGPKKVWDSNDCHCKCRTVRMCSSGRYFNILTCRCEILRRSLSVENMDHHSSSLNLSSQVSALSSVSTTTS